MFNPKLKKSKGRIRLITGCVLAAALFGPVAVQADDAEDQSRIRAFILRGKNFYAVQDYQSAIKTWVQVLQIDPLHEEAIELIDDAKFRAEYQIAVVDKLEKEKRLKTPYSAELSKLAEQMRSLLDEAESKKTKESLNRLTSVSEQEAVRQAQEQTQKIQQVFNEGLDLFLKERHEEAFEKWDAILRVLPEGDDLRVRIERLKTSYRRNLGAVAQAPEVAPAAPVAAEAAAEIAPAEPVVLSAPAVPAAVESETPAVSLALPDPAAAPTAVTPAAPISAAAQPEASVTPAADSGAGIAKPVSPKSFGWPAAAWGLGLLGLIALGAAALRFRVKKFSPRTPPRVTPMGANPSEFNPKLLAKKLKTGGKEPPIPIKEKGLLD